MATIVRHKGDGRCYILLGTGFGAFRSARPGMIFGDILPNEEQGEYTMVSVSDPGGNIRWTSSASLTVVEVDGKAPAAILLKRRPRKKNAPLPRSRLADPG